MLGKGPTSFFYLWKSPSHTLTMCSLACSQRLEEIPMQISSSLHSSLFSDAPLHRSYWLLSLQTLIRLPSSAILHSVLELSFSTSWPRKYVWQKAGGITEHTLLLFPGCLCEDDTPVPVTPICLEAKFSLYLSCLVTSCSLLMFSDPSVFCLFVCFNP